MKTSKEILLKAGLLPKLQLGIKQAGGGVKSTGKHTVKVVEDKIVKKPPQEGYDEFYVRYIFEENDQKVQYDTHMRQKGSTDPSYFVQTMAGIEAGETISLEMKKAGIKNYIEILRVSTGEIERADTDDEETDELTDEAKEEILEQERNDFLSQNSEESQEN